jgi:hypothetical protein
MQQVGKNLILRGQKLLEKNSSSRIELLDTWLVEMRMSKRNGTNNLSPRGKVSPSC